jgi:hypothetical protein
VQRRGIGEDPTFFRREADFQGAIVHDEREAELPIARAVLKHCRTRGDALLLRRGEILSEQALGGEPNAVDVGTFRRRLPLDVDGTGGNCNLSSARRRERENRHEARTGNET